MAADFFSRPLSIRSLAGERGVERVAATQVQQLWEFGGSTPFAVPPSPYNMLYSCDDPILASKIFTLPRTDTGAPIYAAALPRCLVTPCGAVVLEDGTLLLESLYSYDLTNFLAGFASDIERRGDELFLRPRRAVTHVPGTTVYNRDIGEFGYFHWINSILPRFDIIRRLPDLEGAKFLIFCNTPFASRSLELLGMEPESIVPLRGDFQVCDRLYFLSPWGIAGNHWTRPPEIRQVFERFKSHIGILARDPDKRIYLSRRDASVRGLKNEAAAFDKVMRDRRFAMTVTSDMPLEEQAALFHGTELCVSVHGAGLSNLVFMQPGSSVIEIISPDRLWPTYRSLAARMNIGYTAISGQRLAEDGVVPGSLDAGNLDFAVSLEALDYVIDCVLN